MLRKLILLIIIAIFLTSCGASPPDQEALKHEHTMLCRADEESGDQIPVGTEPCGTPMITEAAEDSVSPAEYFLFSSTSNTVTDDSGLTLLYENQCSPTFTSPDSGRAAWVAEILDGISRDFLTDSRNLYQYAQEFVENNGSEYFYSYSNYQQIGAARHDETVVSLISLSSLYSGGTHPISVQIAYNLDIAGRRVLRLEDVIEENAAPALEKLVLNRVDEKFAAFGDGSGLFEDYHETIATSMNYGNMTPYWYFNDAGLVVFYNQYELGPYTAGIIKVELPYDDLGGILREGFYPSAPDGSHGDLFLCEAGEGYSPIPITIERDGKTLLVGVEGSVHQVQLSEVLWLEDTSISQNLIFSALTLQEGDVLEITGGYTDASRSFVIEFVNGAGEHRLYYLHDGELSADP